MTISNRDGAEVAEVCRVAPFSAMIKNVHFKVSLSSDSREEILINCFLFGVIILVTKFGRPLHVKRFPRRIPDKPTKIAQIIPAAIGTIFDQIIFGYRNKYKGITSG